MLSDIKELFDYNTWATQRVFGPVCALSPEEFQRDLKSSFPSIRETLLHFISAEWIWLSRWNGVSPSQAPETWDTSTAASLRSVWEKVNRDLNQYISKLTEADLNKVLSYRNIKGDPFSNRLPHMMRHVVNHSTYHRGQITTMLRQLGKDAVSTDLIVYYREKVK